MQFYWIFAARYIILLVSNERYFMAEADRKVGILNRIKSLVAKTGRGIIWRGRPKDNEITEKIAQKIQKNSYDFSMMQRKDTYTPPYLNLADQLQVDDEQIFQAAVYNLANIAIARPRYKADIVGVLQGYLNKNDINESRREYVAQKLVSIK